jgi:hypothetical protein
MGRTIVVNDFYQLVEHDSIGGIPEVSLVSTPDFSWRTLVRSVEGDSEDIVRRTECYQYVWDPRIMARLLHVLSLCRSMGKTVHVEMYGWVAQFICDCALSVQHQSADEVYDLFAHYTALNVAGSYRHCVDPDLQLLHRSDIADARRLLNQGKAMAKVSFLFVSPMSYEADHYMSLRSIDCECCHEETLNSVVRSSVVTSVRFDSNGDSADAPKHEETPVNFFAQSIAISKAHCRMEKTTLRDVLFGRGSVRALPSAN